MSSMMFTTCWSDSNCSNVKITNPSFHGKDVPPLRTINWTIKGHKHSLYISFILRIIKSNSINQRETYSLRFPPSFTVPKVILVVQGFGSGDSGKMSDFAAWPDKLLQIQDFASPVLPIMSSRVLKTLYESLRVGTISTSSFQQMSLQLLTFYFSFLASKVKFTSYFSNIFARMITAFFLAVQDSSIGDLVTH